MSPTRTLILMRHATAAGAYRDEERPLTGDGVRDANAVGMWIQESLPQVDAVLCSIAVRTRETLAATAVSAPTTYVDELYGAGIDDILAAIEQVPDTVQTLLVVGHAPGIPATAAELATIASLARDEDRPPQLDALRHFAACTLAVLTTDCAWSELSVRGADLAIVRHPDN